MRRIVLGDNLAILPALPRKFARLVYIDPPFNTGRLQKRDRMRVRSAGEDELGERAGFGGRRFAVERLKSSTFADRFEDYVSFLLDRIALALPCMTADASLFVHLDCREVHYIKVALDGLLGRDRFMNEIVWAYDYGARSKSRWPAKHDTILWYARDPKRYVFEYDAIDRIPYMAPGLVTKEKAARGKTPTDVWWHTIVPTNGREKTGYPTQKPLGIIERIVRVHSRPGDVVLDFFGGSGTTGEAAAKHGRDFVLVDQNVEACRVAAKRLAAYTPELEGFTTKAPASSSKPSKASKASKASKLSELSKPSKPKHAKQAASPEPGDPAEAGETLKAGKARNAGKARKLPKKLPAPRSRSASAKARS